MIDIETEETIWEWTPQRERAAQLVAEDVLTNAKIAATVGVTRRTLQNWLRRDEFRVRVAETAKSIIRDIRSFGIANVRERIKMFQEDLDDLNEIKLARAEQFSGILESGEDPSNPDARVHAEPGIETGLVTKRVTTVFTKEGERVTVDFIPDYGLPAAKLALADAAAKHLGQIISKGEITGANGGPIRVADDIDTSHFTMEELEIYEYLLMKATAGPSAENPVG